LGGSPSLPGGLLNGKGEGEKKKGAAAARRRMEEFSTVHRGKKKDQRREGKAFYRRDRPGLKGATFNAPSSLLFSFIDREGKRSTLASKGREKQSTRGGKNPLHKVTSFNSYFFQRGKKGGARSGKSSLSLLVEGGEDPPREKREKKPWKKGGISFWSSPAPEKKGGTPVQKEAVGGRSA